MEQPEWLLFLSQLPPAPDSLRVMVWRRMRGVGAALLQEGTWILPHTTAHEAALEELRVQLAEQGTAAQVFRVQPLDPAAEAEVVGRFRAERDQEYAELVEQCEGFIAEVEQAVGEGNFTPEELEESEQNLLWQNLQRLDEWMERIGKRDFFKAAQAETAREALEGCRRKWEEFAEMVGGKRRG